MASQVHPPRDNPTMSTKPLCGALCIVFDSESVGFAGALARVFKRLSVCVCVHVNVSVYVCVCACVWE